MPAPTASAEATKDAEDSGRPVGYVEPLSGAGALPVVAYTAYRRAADAVSCGLDWTLLAGIGKVESNHGRDSFTETGEVEPAIFGPPTMFDGARAEGPMQFMPFTWERYAADGNADGLADTQNMYDATLAAAHYLCAAGGDVSVESGRYRAVFAYNHLDSYVHNVLEFARVYADGLPESAATLVPIEDVAPEQDPDPSLSASPVAGTPIAEPPPVDAPSETPSAGPTPTPTVVPPPPPPPPTTPTTAPPTTPTTAPPTTTPAPAPPSSEASTAASSPSPMPAPTPSNASPSPTPSPAPSGA